jgi:hypothetical protein
MVATMQMSQICPTNAFVGDLNTKSAGNQEEGN